MTAAESRLAVLADAGAHCRHVAKRGLYDLVIVIGHNDDPVIPGMGSAIFLHVASPDYRPTQGCIAVCRDDLLALLGEIGPEVMLEVNPPANS